MRRIERYMQEAASHIASLQEALAEIPAGKLDTKSFANLTKLQKFAYEIVLFRFSKLQDLLGAKLFRAYLECNGFVTSGLSFEEILKELEKEGIVDIDTWAQLRKVRNAIAHDYPDEVHEQVAKINYVLRNIDTLLAIYTKIEERCREA